MADIDNEKAQFLLAAARILKWKHGPATWTTGRMQFHFPGVAVNDDIPNTSILIRTEFTGWDGMSHTEKLDAAESALRAVIADHPTFDPTIPAWIEQEPAA